MTNVRLRAIWRYPDFQCEKMTTEEEYDFNKKAYWREIFLNNGKHPTFLDCQNNIEKTLDLIENFKRRLRNLFSQNWWASITSGRNILFKKVHQKKKLNKEEISSVLHKLKERNSKFWITKSYSRFVYRLTSLLREVVHLDLIYSLYIAITYRIYDKEYGKYFREYSDSSTSKLNKIGSTNLRRKVQIDYQPLSHTRFCEWSKWTNACTMPFYINGTRGRFRIIFFEDF